MKKLFLNKTLHLMKQSNSEAKNRLDQLKILNDLTKDKNNGDLHSTHSLLSKICFESSSIKENSEVRKELESRKISFLKRIENYLGESNMLKLLLKNKEINFTSGNSNNINLIHNQLSEVLEESKTSQEDEFSRMKWIRHLILILFLIKILEKQNIRCDYDINDMMVTIELEERLMIEEEENEKHEKEEREKNDKKKEKSKRNSVNFKGPTKDERYGTMEEMLRHQMESSEDFGSVEERMMFKEREENRNKEALSKDNKSEEKEPNIKEQEQENNENIADVVFRQETNPEVTKVSNKKEDENIEVNPVVYDEKGENIIEDILPVINSELTENIELSSKIDESNANNLLEEINKHVGEQNINEEDVNLREQLITAEKNESEEIVNNNLPETEKLLQKETHESNNLINTNQQTIHIEENHLEEKQTKENHAIIKIPLDKEFINLSKNIENFLKLRGINVDVDVIEIKEKKEQNIENEQQQQQKNNRITLNLCNKIMDCKEINIQKELSENIDLYHHINNFLNPPHIINSIQEAKELLKTIEKDENIIGSYIPEHESYEKSKKPISQFDTFSTRYPQLDPKTAEKRFNEYKYLSSSKKNCYVIIRDKEIANYMKISTNKIGIPHVLYKYDKELNGKQSEPNCKIDGEFYHMIGNFDKFIEKEGLNTIDKVAKKINVLTERNFTLINSIEDMYDKIRQLKEQSVTFSFNEENHNEQQINPHKKLFVIKINDPKSETEINAILEKLSKMNKNEVSIVKTQSEVLLKSLGVFSNEEYGTMRLFDLEHRQEPIVKESGKELTKGYYERYVPNVPFQVEFLSRWISNITPYDKPYEEYDRSVNKLRSSHPGDFESTIEEGKLKLVLFYKEGCKGCKMMEDLLSRIVELKQRLKENDTETAKRIKREICLRYRIEDAEHLKNLEISKFNILNDDQSIEVPQTTPTIYLFNETNKEKVLLKTDQIFSHLNKINTNNGEVVQDHMVRDLIEEIEKGNKRLESVY